jgi:hypothetical protein
LRPSENVGQPDRARIEPDQARVRHNGVHLYGSRSGRLLDLARQFVATV